MGNPVLLTTGDMLAGYGFGDDHPFGPDRQGAFLGEARRRGLDALSVSGEPVRVDDDTLLRFQTREYVDFVRKRCAQGGGHLDDGDTPAQPGIDVAAEWVAGSTADAVDRVMTGEVTRAMVPIGGLHHAGRGHAAGFCVYNDIGVAIERLRQQHGLARIAYVDIDAHHGDGVFYAYESDPSLFIADLHEDGRFLYPGTGDADETGTGDAAGTKLNIPLPPGTDDAAFADAWSEVEAFIDAAAPEFVILQCGADSMAGDPITHMALTEASHGLAARALCAIADRHAEGRMIALGGGGYNRRNLAFAWCTVLQELLQ